MVAWTHVGVMKSKELEGTGADFGGIKKAWWCLRCSGFFLSAGAEAVMKAGCVASMPGRRGCRWCAEPKGLVTPCAAAVLGPHNPG